MEEKFEHLRLYHKTLRLKHPQINLVFKKGCKTNRRTGKSSSVPTISPMTKNLSRYKIPWLLDDLEFKLFQKKAEESLKNESSVFEINLHHKHHKGDLKHHSSSLPPGGATNHPKEAIYFPRVTHEVRYCHFCTKVTPCKNPNERYRHFIGKKHVERVKKSIWIKDLEKTEKWFQSYQKKIGEEKTRRVESEKGHGSSGRKRQSETPDLLKIKLKAVNSKLLESFLFAKHQGNAEELIDKVEGSPPHSKLGEKIERNVAQFTQKKRILIELVKCLSRVNQV